MALLLFILTKLEIFFRTLREILISIKYKNFLHKYQIEEIQTKKQNIHYNPYEGTSTILLDTLIESNIMHKDDKILDVGCGVGVFMIYLATKGFKYIIGYELNQELYLLCLKNIARYKEIDAKPYLFVYNCDAVKSEVDDSISIFYLYNPFYDTETYLEWLGRIHNSFMRKQRLIKIIMLYPTLTFRIAVDQSAWLIKKCRIICTTHPCSKCIHFLIYETRI